MNPIIKELAEDLPDAQGMARVIVRLLAAAAIGAIVGLQRERAHKPAGLRTHMLVCLGTAFFVITSIEAGIEPRDLSRVIQGIVTGIGFIGGGSILKLSEEKDIRGLTTAASLWMTAALGVAAGVGHLWAAFLGVVMTWIILALIGRFEFQLEKWKIKTRSNNFS